MLDRPAEPVTGRRLVVLVPEEMEVWGRERLATFLLGDSVVVHRFRTILEDSLRAHARFEHVEVRGLPDTLSLLRQRFRLMEGRAERIRIAELPAPGTSLSFGGEAPDYVVFLNDLDLNRIRPRPSVPVLAVPVVGPVAVGVGMAGRQEDGARWSAVAALWDNRVGAPVHVAPAEGFAEFANRHLANADNLTLAAWTASIGALAEGVAEALNLARAGATPGGR